MTTLPAAASAGKVPAPPRRIQLHRGDYEFLPAALEILETPLSPVRTTMMLTICAFAAIALAWSYFGRVDIIASAQGKIQPVGRTKTIQPLETGKVLKIEAQNGQHVKAGDVLVTLDPGEAQADEGTILADIGSEKAETLRRTTALMLVLKHALGPVPAIAFGADIPADIAAREQRVLAGDIAQLATTVASLEGQRQEKIAERERLKATIAAQETLVATLKERVDMRQELLATKSESRAKVIDALELMQTQAATLASEKGQLGEIDASLARIGRDIDKSTATFTAENAQKLADAQRLLDENQEKLAKARIKTADMTLRSPIDGTVQGSTVTSVGQVLTVGEQVMQIVPTGSKLEIECYLPNADVGFVRKDQSAIVKIESFPFTDYGTINATVTEVARDAIPQPDAEQREGNPAAPAKDTMFAGAQRMQNLVFPVTLDLDQTAMTVGGTEVPFVPGMAVTVEIKTGSRRIISYIFSPLVEVATTAFKER